MGKIDKVEMLYGGSASEIEQLINDAIAIIEKDGYEVVDVKYQIAGNYGREQYAMLLCKKNRFKAGE